jgi:hypothetical protein
MANKIAALSCRMLVAARNYFPATFSPIAGHHCRKRRKLAA